MQCNGGIVREIKPAFFAGSVGYGCPALREERSQQRQVLRVGLQIEKEGPRQIAAVGLIGLLVTAHLEQSANDMKAVADVLESLRLLVWIVSPRGEVIHHGLAAGVLFLPPEPN